MNLCFFWVLVITISFIAEILTAQLVSVWFVAGGVLALIVSLFTSSLIIQISIFLLTSLFMILLIRPFVKNMLKFKIEQTNSASLIGTVATVTETINNQENKGSVRAGGLIWSARSRDGGLIKINESVKIDSISGVKLIVHKL